jgi:peptidoglycan LD-endopeptidase CwlK
MASRRLEDLQPILEQVAKESYQLFGVRFPNHPQPFTTCTFRPCIEQQQLLDQPKDGKDNNGNGIIDDASEKVTWAGPGQSPHNYNKSFAWDVAFINPVTQKLDWSSKLFKMYADVVQEVAKERAVEITWGGDWNGNGITTDEKKQDAPHHELKGWKVVVQSNNLKPL